MHAPNRASKTVIERLGRWFNNEAIVNSYLLQQPPEGLLLLAGFLYKDKGQTMSSAYWAPRFMAGIPAVVMEECKVALFPFLPQLRETVDAMGTELRLEYMSVCNNLSAMEYISECAVQVTCPD